MGKIQSIAVGLAVFMTAALTTFAVDAKTLRVCFKTADNKHYVARGARGGYLDASATKCEGSAVFLLHDAKGKRHDPKFGAPVVMMAAAKKRYVWVNVSKKTAFATKSKYKKRDKRFMVEIKTSSGAGKGSPLTPGVKISMVSFHKGMQFFTPDGGGDELMVGKPPRGSKKRWSRFKLVKARK